MTAPYLERISDYPAHHAARTPDAPALTLAGAHLDYRAFADAVERTARALLASGVGRGDRVALLSTPRPEFFTIFLATARIGAVWVGLNPRYTARELAYVLGDARPKLVFAQPRPLGEDRTGALAEAFRAAGLDAELVAVVEDGPGATPHADFLARAARTGPSTAARAINAVDGADPALLVYTSGSTGAPKGALIRHCGLVRLGVVEAAAYGVDRPRQICNQPINHIGCVGDLCGVPLVAGGSLVFTERFDADATVRLIAEERITGLMQVPTQVQRLTESPLFAGADLGTLEHVAWGGAALPRDVIAKLRARGIRLTTTYGSTEVTSSVTYSDPGADDDVLATTVGRPDPELDVRLRTADGRWAAPGEEGEVCVRHPTVMAGYLDRPAETAAAFTPDGHLRTGDVGVLRPDGNLRLVGRMREMYKSGGYNIYPREIELVIEDCPGVGLAAVVARPDAAYQEVGVAYVQPEPGATIGAGALDAWCRERMANFKVPKEFHVLAELPLLPIGKVDKQELRRLAAS